MSGEAPGEEGAAPVAPPIVVSAEQARKDTEVEALVLAGDLCELARLLTGRLKETVIAMNGHEDLATLGAGMAEVERMLVQAKAALDLGTSCARV